MPRINPSKETPSIEVHATKEHGYPHCHVGPRGLKVYVFTDGISPECSLRTSDLRLIYEYYNNLIQCFTQMGWPVVACPPAHRNNLYHG